MDNRSWIIKWKNLQHFPGTVTDFTTCSLPPFLVCTFDLLPKSDDVVTFYRIYLRVS